MNRESYYVNHSLYLLAGISLRNNYYKPLKTATNCNKRYSI